MPRPNPFPRAVAPRLFRATALPLVASLGLLVSCAQKGDFGRPKPGVWNGLIETTGTIVAGERGGPASFAPLTDDERDLRGRAWRFLMPVDTEDAFLDILANLTRARVLPPAWREPAPGQYYDSLVGPDFRSPVSRYRKLTDDAVADARLIPPFAALAARVADADAKRLRSLPFARTLDDETVREAAMRVAENRCLVAWVRLETGARLAGYRFALEHLFAESPDPGSVEADRAVAMMAARRPLLDPLLPPDAAIRCGLLPPPVAAVAAPPLVVKY
jgi:hypothetical protein